jgi:hypothetical protein
LDDHKSNTCNERNVVCPNGCDIVDLRYSQVDHHVSKVCAVSTVQCSNDGCKER